MRYSVHLQNTTGEWVLFDNVYFCMIPARFKSEREAFSEAFNLMGSDRQRRFGENSKLELSER